MQVVKLVEAQKLAFFEEPIPSITREDDVLIRIHAAGICGTDLHIYQGHRPDIQLPRVLGHELAGEVRDVGESVTSLKPGDHVVIDPVIYCGTCYACRSGRNNICTTVKCLGCQVDGGFREYLTMPAKNVYKIADDLPWEHAALAEPFSIAAQVLERGELKQGEHVAILGAGTIGLSVLQVFKFLGANVLIADIVESRLEKARQLGADLALNLHKENIAAAAAEFTQNEGISLAVEAVGHKQLLNTALQILTRGGRIVVLGLDKAQLDLTEFTFVRTEIDIRGSVLNSQKFPQVIAWFEQQHVTPQTLVTETYPLEAIAQAFTTKIQHPQDSLKTLITF